MQAELHMQPCITTHPPYQTQTLFNFSGQLCVRVEDKAEEGRLFRARDGEWMLLAAQWMLLPGSLSR